MRTARNLIVRDYCEEEIGMTQGGGGGQFHTQRWVTNATKTWNVALMIGGRIVHPFSD